MYTVIRNKKTWLIGGKAHYLLDLTGLGMVERPPRVRDTPGSIPEIESYHINSMFSIKRRVTQLLIRIQILAQIGISDLNRTRKSLQSTMVWHLPSKVMNSFHRPALRQ